MSLYRKYRPQTFDDVIGNETVVSSLRTLVAQENKPHSYLFHGPTGCGKTTLGRILAKELGCRGIDFREVDSADFRGIDTIRDIRKQSGYTPLEGPCKVWLADECHKLTNDAQNALLKALEDTPPHVYYILCTTDPQKLLGTIKGRCAQYQVSQLNDKQITKLLRSVIRQEGESIQPPVLEQIVQDSQGHPRNALQILEQVLSVDPDRRLKMAQQAAETQSQTIELCRSLLRKDSWKKISSILSGLKDQEPETIRRQVLGYCSAVLLQKDNPLAGLIMEEMIEPFYNTGFPGLVFACYSITRA